MFRQTAKLAFAAAALLIAEQAYGHHSFAATYLEDQKVTVHGKIVQFLYRNPHSFVHVEATDAQGQTQQWAVEWAAAGQLGRQGITRDTLKVGDEVTVVGNPGRTAEDHRLRMVGITRASDGVKFGGNFD